VDRRQLIKSVKRARTIPSLDGLRTVSVALVILAHAQGTRGFPGWIPRSVADRGTLGVHVFFIISGFLITTLLTEEFSGTGAISLGLFYARRTLRIFPPSIFSLR
jgi:peptidoglycan/LPS O-acetylase OafA/YrhL